MQTESLGSSGAARAEPYQSSVRNTGANHAPSSGAPKPGAQTNGVRVEMSGDNASFTESHAPVTETPVPCAEPDAPLQASFLTDLHAFAHAYNRLMHALDGSDELYKKTAEALREAVYRPVRLSNDPAGVRRISLYEIGVAHSPNFREPGELTVNEKKAQKALESRGEDISVLFGPDGDGLPARLEGILHGFLEWPESENIRAYCETFLSIISKPSKT